MLVLSGVEVESMDGYGSWLSDRLGKTGAGIAIGAAVLGTGYIAQSKYGLGTKTLNLVKKIGGSTTAGKIAETMAPAAAGMAVASMTGQPSGPSPEQVAQQEQAIMQEQMIAAEEKKKADEGKILGVSPWIPLGIIGTVAAGWFALKG